MAVLVKIIGENNGIDVIKRSKITGKKTLVYFPTVTLIEGCWQYIENKRMADQLYHRRIGE